MKIRFFCDVPEYNFNGLQLFAHQNPAGKPMQGSKRVAFEVDFPSDILKVADIAAPTKFIGEVPDLNEPL